jgi:GNAT superfamily N-acetyltransferase
MAGDLFDRRVGHGTVWIADGGAAVAMWDPPRSPSGARSGLTQAKPDRAGLGVEAADHPPQAGRFGRYQAVVHAKMPKLPHWYLGVLAAHPDHRGRRLGRSVMAAGLSRAAADGLPAYLETSNPRNVDVYRGAGWGMVGETSTVDLRIWVMRAPVPA